MEDKRDSTSADELPFEEYKKDIDELYICVFGRDLITSTKSDSDPKEELLNILEDRPTCDETLEPEALPTCDETLEPEIALERLFSSTEVPSKEKDVSDQPTTSTQQQITNETPLKSSVEPTTSTEQQIMKETPLKSNSVKQETIIDLTEDGPRVIKIEKEEEIICLDDDDSDSSKTSAGNQINISKSSTTSTNLAQIDSSSQKQGAPKVHMVEEICNLDDDGSSNCNSSEIQNQNNSSKPSHSSPKQNNLVKSDTSSQQLVVHKVEDIINLDDDIVSDSTSTGIKHTCETNQTTSPKEEEGEVNTESDSDVREIAVKDYPPNVLNGLRSLIAQESQTTITETLKVISSCTKEINNEVCISSLKSIVKKESKKQLKKFSQVNKQQLAGVFESINHLSHEVKKIKERKRKKKSSDIEKDSKKVRHEDRRVILRHQSPLSSSSSSSCDNLPSQYKSKKDSRSKGHQSRNIYKSRYSLSPQRKYISSSKSRKSDKYYSSSDSSSPNRKPKHAENKSHKLQTYKPRRRYSDICYSSSSSPERAHRKRKYSSSASESSPTRKRINNSSSSPLKKSYSSIIQKQTTVTTTTYKAELQEFTSHVRNKRETGSDSDDSLSGLELTVYDDKNTDVTKNRPGGDIYHTFYIHPEDIELYRLRLKKDPQPVQALHEICTKCGWALPTYLMLPSQKGFKFGMVLQEHRFITSKVATQKKLARAEAAKQVLQWLNVVKY